LSFHSVAVVLTLEQPKQIRINIHKRNNIKHSTNNTKHSKYKYTHYQNTHTLQNISARQPQTLSSRWPHWDGNTTVRTTERNKGREKNFVIWSHTHTHTHTFWNSGNMKFVSPRHTTFNNKAARLYKILH
jgi:hypothetical protein